MTFSRSIAAPFVAMAIGAFACSGDPVAPRRPASLSATSALTGTAIAGAPVAPLPSVLVRDADGDPMAGVSVAFAVSGGNGVVTGGAQVTNESGIATVGAWTLGTTTGVNTLSATVSALAPVTFTFNGVAGPAVAAVKSAGDQSTATVGTAVAPAPAIVVRDANGNGVPGVAVTFAVTPGNGTITGGAQTTNANGVATVGAWTLGPTAGNQTLSATAGTLPPVTFVAMATPAPAIALSAAATTPVFQGDSVKARITVARTHFTGAVSFVASGVPAGATASFSPSPTSVDTTQLVLAAGTAAAGTYSLTVTGSGTGVTSSSTTVSVTIKPLTSVTVNTCGAIAWAGYQSGHGAWKTLAPSGSGGYTFAVADVGGFAYVRTNATANIYATSILLGAAADLQRLSAASCTTTTATKAVTIPLRGLGGRQPSFVAANSAESGAYSDTAGSYVLHTLQDGAHDIIGVLSDSIAVRRVIVRRDQNPPPGSTLAIMDFSSSEAADPAAADATVTGMAGQGFLFSTLRTGNGAFAPFEYRTAADGVIQYHTLPGSLARGDDEYTVSAVVDQSAAGRGASMVLNTPTAIGLDLGPSLATPVLSSLPSQGRARILITLAAQSEYRDLMFAFFSQPGRSVAMEVLPSWFGTLGTEWRVEVPDLSAASGYAPAWGLATGVSTTYQVEADGGNVLGTVGTQQNRYAYVTGSIVPTAPSASSSRMVVRPLRASPVRGALPLSPRQRAARGR